MACGLPVTTRNQALLAVTERGGGCHRGGGLCVGARCVPSASVLAALGAYLVVVLLTRLRSFPVGWTPGSRWVACYLDPWLSPFLSPGTPSTLLTAPCAVARYALGPLAWAVVQPHVVVHKVLHILWPEVVPCGCVLLEACLLPALMLLGDLCFVVWWSPASCTQPADFGLSAACGMGSHCALLVGVGVVALGRCPVAGGVASLEHGLSWHCCGGWREGLGPPRWEPSPSRGLGRAPCWPRNFHSPWYL